MPKRKNPFGDTAPIQLKTHVGFKQAATEKEKQEVYEKTVAILFQGANPHLKTIPGVFTTNGATNGYSNGYHNHSNGHGVHMNGDSKTSNGLKVEKCVSCSKSPTIQHLLCSHCHRQVCSEPCLRLCYHCNQPYCHYCSVLSYEGEIRALCFDCLPVNS